MADKLIRIVAVGVLVLLGGASSVCAEGLPPVESLFGDGLKSQELESQGGESREYAESRGYTVHEFAQALAIAPGIVLSQPSPKDNIDHIFLETELGRVSLRYPPRFTSLLGESPVEIVRGALTAAATFAQQQNFPLEFRDRPYDWNIIVSDQSPPPVEGSRVSSEYCHTAFMGPPADIYVDGFRLLHPCSEAPGTRPPKRRLSYSLVHEVAHALEYQLLGRAFSRRQRWHSEGFASWFESRAVEYLKSGNAGAIRAAMIQKAVRFFRSNWRPYLFTGSPEDYARSYALIAVIAESGSVTDLFRVYARMSNDLCSFEEAVQRELGWTYADWIERTKAFLVQEQELINAPRTQ